MPKKRLPGVFWADVQVERWFPIDKHRIFGGVSQKLKGFAFCNSTHKIGSLGFIWKTKDKVARSMQNTQNIICSEMSFFKLL